MKPGLTQMDLESVDLGELDKRLARAREALGEYDAAIAGVTKLLGMDSDELGFEQDEEMLDWDAEELVMRAQAMLSGEGEEEEEGKGE